jgi:uncharacterized protein (TIGR03437 family)
MKRKKKTFNLLWLLLSVGGFLGCNQKTFAQQVPLFEWAGSTGGSTGLDPRIAIDISGNIYTTGEFLGTIDLDPGIGVYNITSAGTGDVFISKVDKDGNFVWAKSLGGSAYDKANAITTDAAGNVYTTGYFNGTADFDPGTGVVSFTAASKDVFISKLDPDGNFVWAKQFGGPFFYEDEAYAIAVDASGNVYTTGFFKNTTDFDPGPGVFNISHTTGGSFISKLDTNGNFVWAKSFTGTNGGVATGNSLALDAAGNVYTAGMYGMTIDFDPGAGVFNLTSTSTYVYSNTFISKLDNDGNFVWAKSLNENYDGGLTFNEYSVVTDASANVYLTSRFIGTQDFDPGAGTFNLTSAGDSDIYILKLDSSGEFVWVKSFGSTDYDGGRAAAIDAAGNIYFTGFFSGTVDVDPGAGTVNLTSAGFFDILVCKLDSNGNFVWAGSVKANAYDKGTSLALDASGNVHTAGYFYSTGDFDPGPCTYNLTSTGTSDLFVLKLKQGTAIPGPTITSFSPSSGSVGTSVTITGTNFSATLTDNVVTFYNNKPATVTAGTATSITATVPSGTVTGKISVTTNCMTATSVDDFTIGVPLLPTITSFTPATGPVGTTVTITGTNLSTTPANNTVRFNGTNATVSASTTTSITVTVPSGATTGKITVTVGGNTATSTTNFTVTTAPTIIFTTQPANRTLCAGTTTTLTLVASGDTNLQYRWQINNAGFADLTNNTTYSGVNTATLTITNPTTALNGKVYRCVVRGDNSVDTPSASASLTVNSIPNAPTIGTNDLGCAPASTTLTPAGAIAGESYRYYDAATAGNLIGSGVFFSTPSFSVSTTYFISTYHTTTLCESARTPALVTVQTCNPPVVIATTAGAYLEGVVTVDLTPLISDPDNNIDASTLQIISQPLSGAIATLDVLMLTVDYNGLPFPGTDVLRIGICDLTEICTEQELTIETAGDITVYNALSPNNDGKNDTFILRYIDLFTDTQNNNVTIFNRWGDVIFETENYDNKDRVFKGLNKGGNEVPSGTYFYKIEFSSGREAKMGYLLLKR